MPVDMKRILAINIRVDTIKGARGKILGQWECGWGNTIYLDWNWVNFLVNRLLTRVEINYYIIIYYSNSTNKFGVLGLLFGSLGFTSCRLIWIRNQKKYHIIWIGGITHFDADFCRIILTIYIREYDLGIHMSLVEVSWICDFKYY